ncbi:flavin reductase family protein [Corynebacterium sp. A21]|uniref:flavin reductase family protein n=1 Tax=Corynebacterium sp. A21 TaxID=3457318 RepID=UPI003FD22790
MTASEEHFRSAFRAHPTGVAVITAQTEEGPVGITASSVSSLALDPLAISFSLQRQTGSAGKLLTAKTYLVHLLADMHADMAGNFARTGDPRFTEEQGWETLETGEPYLRTAPYAMRVKPVGSVRVGEATLIAAEVLEVIAGPVNSPLVYQDRTFRSLSDTYQI